MADQSALRRKSMMSAILIETDRLILRTVTLEDIAEVASSWRLDEGPISLSDAEKKIEDMLCHHEQNVPGKIVHVCLAITLKGGTEIIGWCGLDHTNPQD